MQLGDRVPLGNTGIRISRAGFGVHPLGPARKNLSVEAGSKLMLYAWEQGIDFFDTSQFYETYHYLLAALRKIRKKGGRPILCSKSLTCDHDEMLLAIEEACQETESETIDIFLLHQATPGWETQRSGAMAALREARAAGRIRAWGLSSHHEDVIAQAAEIPDLDVVFALYNRSGLGIRRGEEAGTAEGMLRALRLCRSRGKGILGMKVFGGGNLTTDYQASARHVFLECGDVIDCAVVGFTAEREIDELASLLCGKMDSSYNPPTDHMKLHVGRDDCLGCGTCVRICASGAMHFSREDGLAEIDYEKCVGCNYCAIACPERAIVLW